MKFSYTTILEMFSSKLFDWEIYCYEQRKGWPVDTVLYAVSNERIKTPQFS